MRSPDEPQSPDHAPTGPPTSARATTLPDHLSRGGRVDRWTGGVRRDVAEGHRPFRHDDLSINLQYRGDGRRDIGRKSLVRWITFWWFWIGLIVGWFQLRWQPLLGRFDIGRIDLGWITHGWIEFRWFKFRRFRITHDHHHVGTDHHDDVGTDHHDDRLLLNSLGTRFVLLSRFTFSAWTMTGTVAVAAHAAEDDLRRALERKLAEFDDVANRFRTDSELTRVNARAGWHDISPTMERLLDAAHVASSQTQGLCDPTVLPALVALGYDRDFADVNSTTVRPSHGARCVGLDQLQRAPGRLWLPAPGVLDFGAVAKALAADELADELSVLAGCVVEIGGDVAVRGNGPDGPWAIGITDRLAVTGHEPRICTSGGGVATSSIAVRAWSDGRRRVTHVIDPRTGDCVNGPYDTASVAASTCVLANALATAALIWGEDAPYQLAERQVAARLVRCDGAVEFVGGWHREEAA